MMTFKQMAGGALLALAAAGAPCVAMTMVPTETVRATLGQGKLEEVNGNSLRIGGKMYTFAGGSAALLDRKGAPANAARLVAGKTVAFSVADDGAVPRIKELWIID